MTHSRTWTEDEAERTDRTIVEQAEEIISPRFSEGLTVKANADELFVSRSRLYDAFRNVRGMGVTERLRAERMGAACSLLGSGETDVARVARGGIRAHLSVRRGISPNVRLLPHAVAAPSRAVAN